MERPPNVVLIGFMGSGKTTVGKELAGLLNFQFFDTDSRIEAKFGRKISWIFKHKGEKYFREQEKKVIEEVCHLKGYVVSVGGGAWMDEINRKRLQDMGLCIWLKVSLADSWKRLKGNLKKRPILSNSKDPKLLIKNLLSGRRRFYSLAHVSIDTGGRPPKDVAIGIQEMISGD
jgi:shikimate kinase